jgi:glycosyltransferase involved in cell wall biosynthesis
LYVAHNLGALPAAAAAASAYNSRLGFDAEDFHSGQFVRGDQDPMARLTVAAERELLPRCTYVTAAAPGIAEAYRDLCAIPLPTTILNVFPRADRPARRTATSAEGPIRLYWFSQTIGPDRGLETAVAALPLLRGRPVEIHLRGQWQPGYEARLRSLAASCGANQDAIISHAPANPDEMVRCAAAFDVGLALEPPVSVNNDILLSNKVFTYLLAGTALVMSRTAGQSRLMPELGVAARAFDHDNPQSFALALQTWVNSPESLAEARDHAWQIGEQRFNWDLEKETFLHVVTRALEREPSIAGVGHRRRATTDRLAANHR